ncbi:hypothetical protein ACT7LO_001274 [Providencia rettgeri]
MKYQRLRTTLAGLTLMLTALFGRRRQVEKAYFVIREGMNALEQQQQKESVNAILPVNNQKRAR